jgi:hypothetical protein
LREARGCGRAAVFCGGLQQHASLVAVFIHAIAGGVMIGEDYLGGSVAIFHRDPERSHIFWRPSRLPGYNLATRSQLRLRRPGLRRGLLRNLWPHSRRWRLDLLGNGRILGRRWRGTRPRIWWRFIGSLPCVCRFLRSSLLGSRFANRRWGRRNGRYL